MLHYFFAFESGAISKLLNRSVFQGLGKWSYSIFLTHAAILFMVTSAFYNNVLVVSVLLFVILVSKTTYKYIELKGQALGKQVMGFK
ncbi:hypothetical protein UA69_15690 [Photobacterium angustum]|nr:hypothetical protein UA69_15690 [Photobacterium angustum]KJG37043.1 hypothetical protein UA35_17845 [Photobacterium angustum]KJG46576.1 hypothetical protein UA30_17365 [Photobacterium angustum]KJG48996.1 hypothetical protein UA34_21690 [Photobacterium angustum]